MSFVGRCYSRNFRYPGDTAQGVRYAKEHGLPIVSFNIKCGPKEIVEQGVNGYLIEPFNIEEFADILSKLMKTPDLLESFINNSRHNMEKFDKIKLEING